MDAHRFSIGLLAALCFAVLALLAAPALAPGW